MALDPTLRARRRQIDFPLIIAFLLEEDRMVCERTYFDLGTLLRQLGVARDPTSMSGRIETMVSHPLVVGRALLGRLFLRG